MRWLGPRLSSCLLVLYVLCGQVSFSSHVLRTPRGLITLPPLFIWREEEKGEKKDERKVCDRLFPVAQPFTRPGLLLGSAFKNTPHRLWVCMCVCMVPKLLMEFTWSAPDCFLVSSNPFWGLLFCYFGENQFPFSVKSSEHALWRKMMSWLEPEAS